MTQIKYTPEKTAYRFHNHRTKPIRAVMGPPGSGKSVTMTMDLFGVSLRQEPAPDKIRYTRHAIIRSTYGELRETTAKTIKTWFPKAYGDITNSVPMKGHYRIPLPDGTEADIELTFLAIASEDDLSKLDSSEFTCIWLNEANGLIKQLIGKATERAGRYPPSMLWADGKQHITEYFVMMDYNPPPKSHWLVKFFPQELEDENGIVELEDSILFKQPPALIEHVDETTLAVSYSLNPDAENLMNLDNGKKYLTDLSSYLKTGDYQLIETRLLCRYGSINSGKAIHTTFDSRFHVSNEQLKPLRGTNTIIAIDTSGVHPCAGFFQYIGGRWQLIHGLYGNGMGTEEFITDGLLPTIAVGYSDCDILAVCDPANARDQRTATTPTDLMIEYGIPAIPAPTNEFKARVRAVDTVLLRRGKGSLLINNTIEMLIDGLSGEYKYKKVKVQGAASQYVSKPDKNDYSHWCDMLQYFCLYITTLMSNEDTQKKGAELVKRNFQSARRR